LQWRRGSGVGERGFVQVVGCCKMAGKSFWLEKFRPKVQNFELKTSIFGEFGGIFEI